MGLKQRLRGKSADDSPIKGSKTRRLFFIFRGLSHRTCLDMGPITLHLWTPVRVGSKIYVKDGEKTWNVGHIESLEIMDSMMMHLHTEIHLNTIPDHLFPHRFKIITSGPDGMLTQREVVGYHHLQQFGFFIDQFPQPGSWKMDSKHFVLRLPDNPVQER